MFVIKHILILLLIISSILSKKKTKKINKRTHKRNTSKSLYLSKTNQIVNNMLNYQKNLFNKNFYPNENEEDKYMLKKSLIAGVLKILNVPVEKIEAKLATITKHELHMIWKILIKFKRSFSDINVLKELGHFSIQGLDVNAINFYLAINVTHYLSSHIITN